MALGRPGTEANQPVQRIMTHSLSMSSAPLAAHNSVQTPHSTIPLRPLGSNINPSTQSKLTGTNGISAVKTGGFGQSATMQSSQESSQDKQVEQAKLVSGLTLTLTLMIGFNYTSPCDGLNAQF